VPDAARPAPDPEPINRGLRRVHWSVLGTLAVCALLIGARALGEKPPQGDLDRSWSIAALCLAVGAILARRAAGGRIDDVRRFVVRTVAGLLLAGSLGVLGVAVAWATGRLETGLLFTVAGGLLSLRPPARLEPPPPRGAASPQP
jgi:hypothetical protein